MTADLRPMNLGEILDRTLQIYRSRFLVFLSIAAIPALAMRAIHIADALWFHTQSLLHPEGQPGTLMWSFVLWLGFYHISSFFGLLIQPAHINLASASILGEVSSISSALKLAVTRWRSYLWIAFLKTAGDLLIPEIATAGLFIGIGYSADKAGLLDGGANWPFVLMFIVPLVAGVYLLLRLGASLSLTVPASALESLSGFRSLRRSWKLTRESRARIASTWLAIFVTSWILSYTFQLLLAQLVFLLANALHLKAVAHQVYLPVAYATATIVHALFGPIYPIAITLFYYDQRIRREGYDIEWMMQRAGLVVPAPPQQEAEPLPVLQQSPHPTPAPSEGSL